jgi:hypothetical protein
VSKKDGYEKRKADPEKVIFDVRTQEEFLLVGHHPPMARKISVAVQT